LKKNKEIEKNHYRKEKFTRKNKLVSFTAVFFLFVAILSQFSSFSQIIEKNNINKNIPEFINNDFPSEEYKKVGSIGDEDHLREIATVKYRRISR
jgi:hypothetical protein